MGQVRIDYGTKLAPFMLFSEGSSENGIFTHKNPLEKCTRSDRLPKDGVIFEAGSLKAGMIFR
ncbi:hypothetical protein [Lentibacter sp. XHP0401]|uniref:hypothetical protein n=1 Tax=Lentibacter sp. XHP0401 TaxID=2984334 RepID=UPI0021E9228A|nr:hypothetical protein [Lentibacter sp. XHP0401]MCV2892804.1 hypothetical protein [Lentibacter sp. XHP0401]